MATTYLTTSQVAERFGVHPNTVVNWANEGRLPFIRTAGKHRRFAVEDVEALAASLTEPVAS